MTQSTGRIRDRELAKGTHIPSFNLRWFTDYDGERILQQECSTPSGEKFWKDIQEG